MRTNSHSKEIGWIASIICVINALYIFVNSIYPIASQLNQPDVMNNATLVVNLISQEFLAYTLLVLGISLPGRSRIIWWLTVINLILILITNYWLDFTHHNSIMIFANLLFLTITRRKFNKQFYIYYGFAFAIEFVIFALCYGVFGSYLFRHQFANLESLGDALYYSMEVYSTVGFGDIYPLTSTARNFVTSMMFMGILMFTTGITILAYMFNTKLRSLLFSINKGKIAMHNHIVFMGYGILTQILIERFKYNNHDYIIIDSSKNMDTDREILQEKGKLMLTPYSGNKEILRRARVDEAKTIVINFESDSDTIFAIMNIREYLKEVQSTTPKIIARIYYEENISKAQLVGADEVVAPHLLAADAIERMNS